VAVLDRGKRLLARLSAGHLVQRAVGLAAAARGADGFVDEVSVIVLLSAPATGCRAITSFIISFVPA